MDKNRKTVQPSFCAPTCPQPSWNDRKKKLTKTSQRGYMGFLTKMRNETLEKHLQFLYRPHEVDSRTESVPTVCSSCGKPLKLLPKDL